MKDFSHLTALPMPARIAGIMAILRASNTSDIPVAAIPNRPVPNKIHHTMGVYNCGDRTHNGVHPDDLENHIEYNLRMRPGRAFFVDGQCLNQGYLDDDRIKAILEELKENPVVMDKVTLPYR